VVCRMVCSWMVGDTLVGLRIQPKQNSNSQNFCRFVPETKNLTLEQLDEVFSIPTSEHVVHGLYEASYFLRRYLLRQTGCIRPILIQIREDDQSVYAKDEDLQPIGEEIEMTNTKDGSKRRRKSARTGEDLKDKTDRIER
jgi:hypothetical protein